MKKAIIIISFCLSCLVFNLRAEDPNKEKVIELTTNFLNNLQAKEMQKLKNILSAYLQLKTLPYKQILVIADDMMSGKIPVSEYILSVTGHNIQQFLENKYQLIQYTGVQEYGIDRNVDDRKIKGNFYYIKFKITYKNNDKIIENKLIEIDIIKENNKLKIFGFIL